MVTRIGPKKPLRLYLAEWREERNLTQQELADRIGSTKGSISRWETGDRDLTLGALHAIAEALGVDAPALYRDPKRPTQADLLRDMDDATKAQAIRLIQALKSA